MQNRKPNHHDDLSVVGLKEHHEIFEQQLEEIAPMAQLFAALGDDSMLQGLAAEDMDIHAVQDARVADLNKVLEAKKDQNRNVEANNVRYARGEKKYGLFSTVPASNSSTEEVSSLEVSPTLSPKM